jgi:hypothetical protein
VVYAQNDQTVLFKDFHHIIDVWTSELIKYNFTDLVAKPSPTSWSLGQVYVHLIDNTCYYLEQVKICLSNNDNSDGEASINAKRMFHDNEFPNQFIEGPPENELTPQPESKEQLMRGLSEIKNEVCNIEILFSKGSFRGKTKHPGLNFFGAAEWLQFGEMHLRHHLRQKKRIDAFLNGEKSQV